MQLQNLCSLRLNVEEDVLEELGRLPQDLADTYAQIFEHVRRLGSQSRGIAESSLKWLLCQARELSEAEFLAAVSMGSGRKSVNLTKETILFICGNLVMFDHELKVFRFAHLSVREFLETQSEFTLGAAHTLGAETSLLTCLDRYSVLAAQDAHQFGQYATLYWLYHCQEMKKSNLGCSLLQLLEDFLCLREGTSLAYDAWARSVHRLRWSINGTLKEEWPSSGARRYRSRLPGRDQEEGRILDSILGDPTFAACYLGIPEIVERNLKSVFSGPPMNMKEANVESEFYEPQNVRNQTYLHLACHSGSSKLLRLLLQWRFSVRSIDECHRTALHYAVNPHDVFLSKRAKGTRAIRVAHDQAMAAERVAMIGLLIERGSVIDASDRSGETALHRASSANYVTEAQALLGHGAFVDATTSEGQTSLHLAAEAGNTAVAQLLLQSNADIEARDQYGSTPLHQTVLSRRLDTSHLFLQLGADINAKNSHGETPLTCSLEMGHHAMAQMLIDEGADIEVSDLSGNTALHYAAAFRLPVMVSRLLKTGAQKNVTNVHGSTPLHVAIDTKCAFPRVQETWGYAYYIVRLLVDAGADVEMSDDGGRTPLHLAAQMEDKASVRILLHRGANTKAEDNEGLLPLDHAAESHSLEVFSLLFKRWADMMAESSDDAVKSWLQTASKNARGTSVELLRNWRTLSLEDLVELTSDCEVQKEGAGRRPKRCGSYFVASRIRRKIQYERKRLIKDAHTSVLPHNPAKMEEHSESLSS